MIGADLYLTGIERESNNYVDKPAPCIICKKLIINAGIKTVYVRLDKNSYNQFIVDDWLQHTTKDDYMGY